MTIRLLTHVPKDAKPILEQLINVADGEVEIAYQTGDKEADIKASSLSIMNTKRGKSGHLLEDTEFVGRRHSAMATPGYFEDMERFIDHLQRTSSSYKYRCNNLTNLQDYIDYYHILQDTVAETILKSGATHMLYFNIPHMAYETIFYQVGLSLGLKPVLLLQSLFPDQYFSMRSPYDFGRFIPENTNAEPYKIDEGSPLDLFYMRDVKQGIPEKGKLKAKDVGHLFAHILTKDPLKALNPLWMARTIRRMRTVCEGLPEWRDPFASFFHVNNLAYFEHLLEYEQNEVNFDRKFIYFPLNLQPEMTTSAIGHKYRDQVLAIEDLARILPPDIKIYVKENPKQLGFARGPMFFHRLSRIPSVEWMPSYIDTHHLTDAALAVATITGTVGWEAICKGKPAICFGDTWYQSFSGVLRFDEKTSWDDIHSLSVDHSKLENDVGALISRSHTGTLHRHYSRHVENFEQQQNDAHIARTILSLLKDETNLSFPPEF